MPVHGGRGDPVFPRATSTVVPDPSRFFAPPLLAAPLPTNSFFQNFVLNDGDMPEYIHPYLIRSPGGAALDVCYPSRSHSPSSITQTFVADLTISDAGTPPEQQQQRRHVVSAFDDLSVTLDLSPSLRAHLVRGCPYVTVVVTTTAADIAVASVHAFVEVVSSGDGDKQQSRKWRLRMDSGQTFLLYASSPILLTQTSPTQLSAANFGGGGGAAIRVAYLPDADDAAAMESILDRYSRCYPTSGHATVNPTHRPPFSVEYSWRKEAGPCGGGGELLMLAHPLHLRLLSHSTSTSTTTTTAAADDDRGGGENHHRGVRVLEGFRYRSIDGEMVGVVSSGTWLLRAEPAVPPTWHSSHGVSADGAAEVAAALRADVAALDPAAVTTTSSYFYGKAVARAARLAVIAEELVAVGSTSAAGEEEVGPAAAVREFLRATVTPWLEGRFQGNGFAYEATWGGLVTRLGLADPAADFGFGVYNDHHYHLGYFLYAAAVLARLDPAWAHLYSPHAYAMVADFMTVSSNGGLFTRLRMFDLWTLHSWAGGLAAIPEGRNQESSSEAVSAYYSASLLGLTYGDARLASLGATLAALETLAAQTWWHVRENGIYEEDFSGGNRVVGVVWASKRDSALWFAPAEWRECRVGIQLLPLLPASEALFADVGFVRSLVEWAAPALERDGAADWWKGFVYALEGVYDREAALEKVRKLAAHDNGNSLTNLLWWLHSRPTPNAAAAAATGTLGLGSAAAAGTAADRVTDSESVSR